MKQAESITSKIVKLQTAYDNYYQNKFLKTIKSFPRSNLSCVFLLFTHFCQNLTFLFSKATLYRLSSFDTSLLSFQILTFIQSATKYSTIAPILICLILNYFIFLLQIILFYMHVANKTTFNIVARTHSIFAQVYSYLVYLPSSYFSIEAIQGDQVALGVINILLTLTIGKSYFFFRDYIQPSIYTECAISFHDCDFSMNSFDKLSQRQNIEVRLLIMFVQIMRLIAYSIFDESIVSAIVSIPLEFIKISSSHSFNHPSTFQKNLFFSIMILFVSGLVTASQQITTSFPITLLTIVMIPICFEISNLVTDNLFNPLRLFLRTQIPGSSSKNNSIDSVFRVLLANIKVQFELYRQSESSLALEIIINNHIINCQRLPLCFCNELQQNSQSIIVIKYWKVCRQFTFSLKILLFDFSLLLPHLSLFSLFQDEKRQLLSGDLMQLFLLDYIANQFKIKVDSVIRLRSRHTLQLSLSYLSFLLEVKQQKLRFYQEIFRLIRIIKPDKIEQAFINEIMQKADVIFKNKEISQSRIQLQEINKPKAGDIENIHNLNKDMMIQFADLEQLILFEKQITQAQTNFFKLVENKQSVLLFISQDYFDLEQLKQKCKYYYSERGKLHDALQEMNLVNNRSSRLDLLLSLFADLFSFAISKKMLFDKQRRLFYLSSKKRSSQQYNGQINQLPSSSAAIVFVTLLEKASTIKRASSNCKSIFGFNSNELIGKDINIIMPRLVGNVHNTIMKEYLYYPIKYNNQNSEIRIFPFLIAKNKKGWAVPISTYIKPGIIDNQDCGVFAVIQKISSDNIFVMFRQEDLQVEIMSQKMYYKFYQSIISETETENLSLTKVIPILKGISENNTLNSIIQTLAIFPKSQLNKQWVQLTKKKNFQEQLQEIEGIDLNLYNFFKIEIIVSHFINRFVVYNVIEIASIIKISHSQDINEALRFLQVQLKEFTQIDLNIGTNKKETISKFTKINSEIQKSRYKIQKSQKQNKEFVSISTESIKVYDKQASIENFFQYSISQDKVQENIETLTASKTPKTLIISPSHSAYLKSSENIATNQNYDFKQYEKLRIEQSSNNSSFPSFPSYKQGGQLSVSQFSRSSLILQNQSIHNSNVRKDIDQYQENLEFSLLNMNNQDKMKKQPISLRRLVTSSDIQSLDFISSNRNILDKQKENSEQINCSLNQIVLSSERLLLNQPFQLPKVDKNVYDQTSNQNEKPTKQRLQSNSLQQGQFASNTIEVKPSIEYEVEEEEQSEQNENIQKIYNSSYCKSSISHDDAFNASKNKNYNIDLSSIQDSQTKLGSSVSSTRNALRKAILNEKINPTMNLLTIAGTVAVSCVFILTLFVYIEMRAQLNVATVTFQYVPWPINFRCDYTLSSSYRGLQQIITQKVFAQNQRLNSAFFQQINQRIDFASKELSTLFLQYEHGERDKLAFFANFTAAQVTLILSKDVGTIPMSDKLLNIAKNKNYMNTSMVYFLQTSIGFIYRYSQVENNLNEQIVRLDNVSGLISNVTSLDQYIYNQCDQILTTLTNQSQILMIVVILVSLVLLSSIFPLYWYIQQQNEKILGLFAKIKKEHIDEMLKPILDVKLLKKSGAEQIAQPGTLKYVKLLKKKKLYSITTKLPKFKITIALNSLICFLVLSIQPIANYIIIISFSDEVKSNILLASILFKFEI